MSEFTIGGPVRLATGLTPGPVAAVPGFASGPVAVAMPGAQGPTGPQGESSLWVDGGTPATTPAEAASTIDGGTA